MVVKKSCNLIGWDDSGHSKTTVFQDNASTKTKQTKKTKQNKTTTKTTTLKTSKQANKQTKSNINSTPKNLHLRPFTTKINQKIVNTYKSAFRVFGRAGVSTKKKNGTSRETSITIKPTTNLLGGWHFIILWQLNRHSSVFVFYEQSILL